MLKERLVVSRDSVNYTTGSYTLLYPLSKIVKCKLQSYQLNENVWGGKQATVIFLGSLNDYNVQQNLGTTGLCH